MTDSINFDDALSLLPQPCPDRIKSDLREAHQHEKLAAGRRISSWPLSGSMAVMERSDVIRINRKYLGQLPISAPVTLIKSAKNTGKTKALYGALQASNTRVLAIAHRNTLVSKLAKDYQLRGHLDRTGTGERAINPYLSSRLAVTLDSVWKVGRSIAYDVIVLDESEQLLAHFFSTTMRGRDHKAILALRYLISRAKHVVALDADMSWATLNFIGNARPNDRLTIIHNVYRPARGKPLVVHPSKTSIGQAILRAAKNQTCFVVSDEKRYLHRLADELHGSGILRRKVLLITSATAKTDKVRRYLAGPEDYKDNYSVVLASPTVASGIDLSFPENECVYSGVFGVFHGHYFTHTECDQLLSRVRNPGRVEVWVNGKEREKRRQLTREGIWPDDTPARFQSHAEQVEERVADATRNTTLLGYTQYGLELRATDHPLVDLARTVISSRILSRQDLARNFINAKLAEGWKLEEVSSAFEADGWCNA